MDFDQWLGYIRTVLEKQGSDGLDEHDYVRLARGLILREVSPGGPYRNGGGVPTITFNTTIASIFRLLKSPLPAVEAFIDEPSAICAPSPSLSSALTPVQKDARFVIRALNGDVGRTAREAYTRILKADRDGEISVISQYFASSLPDHAEMDPGLAKGLGVANLMAWTAYSLYDDFIDNEGSPRFLPVANITHRAAFTRYVRSAPTRARADCHRVFDGMDAANAWEVAHCRFPVADGRITIGALPKYGRYTVLAARARAHVLGPLIVAEFLAADSAVVARALDHYLIARQLNDDLHDWADDFRRGHINPVVVRLLTAVTSEPGEHEIERLLRSMKAAFWRTELAAVSQRAIRHLQAARRLLCGPAVGMVAGSDFIERVVDPIEDGLRRGLARHDSDKKFLAAYASPASTRAR